MPTLTRKRILLTALLSALALVLVLAVSEGITHLMARGHCHDDLQSCPENRIGLVLGCSKMVGRWPNRFFTGRMDAAAELWHAGKLRCIIVSGDNRTRYYNEPRDMKEALVARGVPADVIVEDFAGLCTYDSVVRARHVFGAEGILIVSQPDHVRRAVAIARCKGMDAEGYGAPLELGTLSSRIRSCVRERGARLAMLYDLLTHRSPTHMGQRIALPVSCASVTAP